MGHALMENRNGLIVDAVTTRASGHAERLAAIALVEPRADRPKPITLGADKAYDTADFVMELREHHRHPARRAEHRAGGARRSTAAPPGIPATRSPSASASASRRLSAGPRRWPGLRKMRHRGLPKVGWQFTLAMAAYNLVRLPKLLAAAAP